MKPGKELKRGIFPRLNRQMPNPFWNNNEQRLRALWRLLIQTFLITFPATVFGVLLSYITKFFQSNITPTAASNSLIFFTDGGFLPIIILFFVVASVLLSGKFLDHRPFRDFGFHFNKLWWLDLVFGLFLGMILMCGIFIIELALGWIHLSGSFVVSSPGISFLQGLIQSILLFVCVGIYEELYSRGYQLHNLAEGFNLPIIKPWLALILAYLASSAIFGGLHAGNPHATILSTFNLTIAGLFLGLGYILTGELAISIGLHITWNFFQGVIFGFPISGTTPIVSLVSIVQSGPDIWTGGSFGPEAGVLSLIAIAVGSCLTILWVIKRTSQVKLITRLVHYPAEYQR